MLQQKYPAVGGLQPPSLVQNYAMEPQTGEFVQVLNIAGNHWITISTIGCKASTVNVYDSMHGNLSTSAQRLVAHLVQCLECPITVQYIDVQWQSGGTDCSLFALAFATSLHTSQDPAATSYNQGQMRTHLLNVLSSKNIQPFPVQGLRHKIQQPRRKLIPVYCICRLTDTGTDMIQCSSCDEWYHTACISVPKKLSYI